jgi:hypothetical protein
MSATALNKVLSEIIVSDMRDAIPGDGQCSNLIHIAKLCRKLQDVGLEDSKEDEGETDDENDSSSSIIEKINDMITSLDGEYLYKFNGNLRINLHRCADILETKVGKQTLKMVSADHARKNSFFRNLIKIVSVTMGEILSSSYGRKFAARKEDGWLVLDGCSAMDTIGPFLKDLVAKNVPQKVD